MKRLGSAMMVGVVAALVATSSAHAQAYFKLGAGAAIPVGDYGESTGTGLAAQGAVGFGSGMIGGRVSASYIRNSITGTDHNFRLIGAMADLVLSPSTSGKVAPYVLAGAGVQNGKSNQSGAPDAETKFAWNAGGGLEIRAGGIGLYLEGRFLSIRTEGSSSNLIPITAGVRLGGK